MGVVLIVVYFLMDHEKDPFSNSLLVIAIDSELFLPRLFAPVVVSVSVCENTPSSTSSP